MLPEIPFPSFSLGQFTALESTFGHKISLGLAMCKGHASHPGPSAVLHLRFWRDPAGCTASRRGWPQPVLPEAFSQHGMDCCFLLLYKLKKVNCGYWAIIHWWQFFSMVTGYWGFLTNIFGTTLMVCDPFCQRVPTVLGAGARKPMFRCRFKTNKHITRSPSCEMLNSHGSSDEVYSTHGWMGWTSHSDVISYNYLRAGAKLIIVVKPLVKPSL